MAATLPAMQSDLGKSHARVIESAPEAMRARMIDLATAALMRRHESDTPDSLACYLDAESLYYMDR